MATHHYGVGDTIVLKDGFARTDPARRTGTVVGILPATEGGDAQYRVRFEAERCERRVVQADIEAGATREAIRAAEPRRAATGSPWLKPIPVNKSR